MVGEYCNPSPECKYFPNCFEDVHHLYHPRSAYKTPLEKEFRRLGCNTMRLCRAKHDDIHAGSIVPAKPTRDEMLTVIERERDHAHREAAS